MSIMRTLTINGVKYNVVPVVSTSSVTLLAGAWVGEGDKYSQVVKLAGVTAHTKVNLQPTPEQLVEFHDKVLGFVAENDGGVVTVYAIGDKPTGDHTIQTTLKEVDASGKIRGNTVGTTMPRPDINQSDPNSAAYVQGREQLVLSVNGVSPDAKGNVAIPTGGEAVSPSVRVESIEGGHRVSITDVTGTKTFDVLNGKNGVPGSLDDDEILDVLLGAEAFTKLQKDVADLMYVPIDITSLTHNAGTKEVGSVVDSVTISWALNRSPESQLLDGIAVEEDLRSMTLTALDIRSNKTFTLKVTDERGATDTASTTINFLKGVYYGVLENGATINSAGVLGLTRSLRSNHMPSFTVNAGATQRIAYAHPTNGFNAPVFNVGGFEGGFSKASTFQFTNASGHTESYDIYLSDNVNLGSTTVKVS